MNGSSDKETTETQLILHATTELEFCEMLRAIWLRSHLTLGQAKVKTGIPRSQIHNLTKKGRSRLPRKRPQVAALVTACGLSDCEVVVVLTLWDQLGESPTS